MKHPLISMLALAGALLLSAAAMAADAAHPRVSIKTSSGEIVVELDRVKAPITVDNFLKYVADGFYSNTTFHRVIADFMIQGGGYTESFTQKPTQPPIRNEAGNGLKNARGTIAMARTGDPHSATAQFFINVVDNNFLNHTGPTQNGWGYAVFGKVVQGMDVVDNIRKLPTGPGGPFPQDVPRKPVIIQSITLMD